ncbi:MAG: DeoR/GlpR family DNA-binding transcription regulator [Christensenellales bacterium]
MNSIRREKIYDFVKSKDLVTIDQLSELFPDVSTMTIHRDLSYLQEKGLLVKVRGGARRINAADEQKSILMQKTVAVFSAREGVNKEAKRTIAQKALSLLDNKKSVFIDAGTTAIELAKVAPNVNCNIITNGPNTALELSKNPLLTITLCGGILNKTNLALSGATTMEMLAAINIEFAFVVSTGYANDYGCTCGNETEHQIKTLVTQKAKQSAMLFDTSKIGRVYAYTFADIGDYDYLITEVDPLELPASLRDKAAAHNVTIL